MKLNQPLNCHCSNDKPILLKGSNPLSPIICIDCKNPVSLENVNITNKLKALLGKWAQIYHSIFTLWSDSIEYKEWAKKQLLDETGEINIEGLELAQQLNESRKIYYWMFQDVSDKNYILPKHCPFCGASLELILNNDFRVCHPCKVAYPDKN
ncbi:MAG: DUF2310 family Zn-ribbon-containing protein [Gammaproteobacteria bacterium]|jgi:hypothetical protein|nr:DUF2310 family Zn-ribbon-containing protein [Gammaproteobacteria bacterium]MBT3725274.1 DUF2310 family Zn-ribbon-containing protein [Gammaproteobacteria bacterium]MBT4076765.1 DUF2310 family Zn-ribbon-containing protein [Gammaproteobacteria bacterium]MBT4195320.1 DUF2310 family Zn-ribbon-containing protein [Gammaproteobacteria bacterium]MBT4449623.1 DUF2310 family Zn-ribbon-containing protein [Gammaproteobacteria bacterium]